MCRHGHARSTSPALRHKKMSRDGEEKKTPPVKYENNGLRPHEYLKWERQKGSKWFVACALRCSVLVPLRALFFKKAKRRDSGETDEKQDCISSDPGSLPSQS